MNPKLLKLFKNWKQNSRDARNDHLSLIVPVTVMPDKGVCGRSEKVRITKGKQNPFTASHTD